MAKYVRKIMIQDGTQLTNKIASRVFKIVAAKVRHKLNITDTCFVPNTDLLFIEIKEMYKEVLNGVTDNMFRRIYPEDVDSDLIETFKEKYTIKNIPVLSMHDDTQRLSVKPEYFEFLNSQEFKEWLNYNNGDCVPLPDEDPNSALKKMCIISQQKLVAALDKHGLA